MPPEADMRPSLCLVSALIILEVSLSNAQPAAQLPEEQTFSQIFKQIQKGARKKNVFEKESRSRANKLSKKILQNWSESGRKLSPLVPLVELELVRFNEEKMKKYLVRVVKKRPFQNMDWKYFARMNLDQFSMRMMRKRLSFKNEPISKGKINPGKKEEGRERGRKTRTKRGAGTGTETRTAKEMESGRTKQGAGSEAAKRARSGTQTRKEKEMGSGIETGRKTGAHSRIRSKIKSKINSKILTMIRSEIRSWIMSRVRFRIRLNLGSLH